MDKLLLLISIILFFWVMRVKRIAPISLYTLFGLQWFFYWLFPLLLALDIVPRGVFAGYPLNYVPEVQFYFFLFNALAMIVWSAVFLAFYKEPKPKEQAGEETALSNNKTLRTWLFFALLFINLIVLFLSVKYPYMKMTWWSHSINSNLRNTLLALFLFYMLFKPGMGKLGILFFLFCVSTVIYGGRVYLLILATCFFFYLYNTKKVKLIHMVAFFLLSIVLLTATGLIRNGLAGSFESIGRYMLMPMYAESVYSSYPGFAVINLWGTNAIQYHNYFVSYLVDPFLIFVPQFIFVSEGEAKASYNLLGQWEKDHGGRENISPQGGYYYMAEAMEALSVPGIFIVVLSFALLCVGVERLKFGSIIGQFTYYNFVGAFGLGFVSDQFAWCARSFGQNLEVVLLFIAGFQLFTYYSRSIRERTEIA